MISKKLFSDCIRSLDNIDRFQSVVLDLTKQYDGYGCVDMGTMMYPACDGELLELLRVIMNDTKNDWIGYFCYELDFGRKWKPGCVEDKNGNDVVLATINDLWALLTK